MWVRRLCEGNQIKSLEQGVAKNYMYVCKLEGELGSTLPRRRGENVLWRGLLRKSRHLNLTFLSSRSSPTVPDQIRND